jgi:alpha-glucosidase
MDSYNSTYQFVPVDRFTPNSGSPWTQFGDVSSVAQSVNVFTFTGVSPGPGLPAPVLKIYILSPTAFRVRFNPSGDYSHDGSYAVVTQNLGVPNLTILQNDARKLSVILGGDVRLDVLLQPFTVQVYLKNNLISTDSSKGLVYLPSVPGAKALANFKNYPANAKYFGFGEKGGPTLAMNENSMTFFNYDNFQYSGPNSDSSGVNAVVPGFSSPGPLNTAEPLYNSIPFLIEDNPNPLDSSGKPTGVPYAYGLLLDNESQTYFNVGQSSSYAGDMYGKYYFGALYGEIDYYFLAGNDTAEVLAQYSKLTGPAALVPMWALGYHQGCYGYFSQEQVLSAVQSYRKAKIPLDGIHIDVDFQNNYRTFTASPKKFPGGGAPTFQALAQWGVKASTNITGIVSSVREDETGNPAPYPVLNAGIAMNAFYQDVRTDDPAAANRGNFLVYENYGTDVKGFNPFQPPGSNLGTHGFYADLGRPAVRDWWGTLYKPLLDAGMEMVWQDMTDPAVQPNMASQAMNPASDSMPWKTLALNLSVFDFTSNSMVPHAQVHNVFALNLISATYEGLVKLRKQSGADKRPFIIARGGYAGVQRYAASWTGDSASDWNFLSILIPEILNFGLSGQPLAGADVGGFATSAASGSRNGTGAYGVTDAELLTRWTTMSAFIGWFRNHYDGYNKAFQEPYAYGEPVASDCRNYIEIRYKLLQYFYDALYECTKTGLPICRPLFLTDRSDPLVYQHLDDQFIVGNDMLVAPVVNPGQRYRDVYLPAGSNWFAYTDNKAPVQGPSQGGLSINWYVPVSLVPVYIRAGAVIPHRELEQFVGQLNLNPLTFDIYPGPDSTHMLYLDDKVSTQAQTNGAYRLTQVSQFLRTGKFKVQTVRVLRTYDHFKPNEPYYFVAMLYTSPPVSVTVDGQPLTLIQSGDDNASAAQLVASMVNSYYYNTSLRTTFVKVFDAALDTQIVGTFQN